MVHSAKGIDRFVVLAGSAASRGRGVELRAQMERMLVGGLQSISYLALLSRALARTRRAAVRPGGRCRALVVLKRQACKRQYAKQQGYNEYAIASMHACHSFPVRSRGSITLIPGSQTTPLPLANHCQA
jgi:hypothetical protein